MRQAIVTRYLGPTNTRGARIRVQAEAKSITVPWDYNINNTENHARAAAALISEMGWGDPSEWHGGWLPEGGYAWVRVTRWSGMQA